MLRPYKVPSVPRDSLPVRSHWPKRSYALLARLSTGILVVIVCHRHRPPICKDEINSSSACTHVGDTDMASGKSTPPTFTKGTWVRNQLYDMPKPAPSQRQNMDVSPSSNLTSDNTTDPRRSPDTVRPLNDGHTSRRTGESRRIEHETVSPGCCLYYTDPLECWA